MGSWEGLGQFRELAELLAKGNNANEETEIWATNFRFSSITDLMEAKGNKAHGGIKQKRC